MRNLVVIIAVLASGLAPGWCQPTPMDMPAEQAPSEVPGASQTERDQRVTPPTTTQAEAIEAVKKAGLMQGDKKGNFHPEKALSRAELAAILSKTFKLETRKAMNPEVEPLKDVSADYWAAKDIDTVMRLGIMKGYRDGYFYPEQRVSRSEALSIFAQAYGVQQYDDATVKTILAPYPDAAQIPDWAEKAMATTLKSGFVDVSATGKIHPLKPMTRGDMAFALGQYLNRLHQSEQGIPY
ncbi:S-layer homology domain-containing protein [Vampirovibrio sp.]|uniref:S-layer homology domain-containing protein n=1 Tax=Vampirovibrio sp. TaxID=2717857 RepID=UPI0035945DBC